MDYVFARAVQDGIRQEMLQKCTKDSFFRLKNELKAQRPTSVSTEFVDTDWDEEPMSEAEDDLHRLSLQSSGQPSFTTVSSYDEIPTPQSSRGRESYVDFAQKQVQGPCGPHLFRSSLESSRVDDEECVLTLSPVTPHCHRGIGGLLDRPPIVRRSSPCVYSSAQLDPSILSDWTPEMVAQSMLNVGLEPSVADRFIENDISGAVLMTLKCEDLRELNLQSLGIRIKVWHQIRALRDDQRYSGRAATPIEDAPSREVHREIRKQGDCDIQRRQSSKRRPLCKALLEEDMIESMDSLSIIGIEQIIPDPHHCSKGERCGKWRKNQKVLEQIKNLNPAADVKNGGAVLIYGDAGNPETARAIDPHETLRPRSDGVASIVASSDIFGSDGLGPLQYLRETTLRSIQSQDTQDNVRQFLNFQQKSISSDRVPPTPPFELAPSGKPAQEALRRLPKLSIPHRPDGLRNATTRTPEAHREQPAKNGPMSETPKLLAEPVDLIPRRADKTAPPSPDLETPQNPYRFGTPFSELDVPVTAVPVGPVAREVSQSVPPDMNFWASPRGSNPSAQPRSQSRASTRRPSFSVLPSVSEDIGIRQLFKTPSPKRTSPEHRQTSKQSQQPRQAPPRFNYPWSPVDRTKFAQALPPLSNLHAGEAQPAPATLGGITCQGPMKKRKTRLLRHEWQDGYFTLQGTRLNMHQDADKVDRTLEYIDVDDYAIACSSLASTSKLSAAFKAVHISHSRGKSDPIGAFSFQLIPQDKNVSARLRKRESSLSGIIGNGHAPEGTNGTGKTHYFAVRNREERIDWMRELMLAKAMKQKGQGFEISVNGNMI